MPNSSHGDVCGDMIENKKRIFIVTNGCPRRRLDATRLNRFFKANNCIIVKSALSADYIIFITCSFKKDKEEECLIKIKEFLKYPGELIVGGCLPDISSVRLKEVFNGRILKTKDLERVDDLFSDFKVKFENIPDAHLLHSAYFSWWRWGVLNLGFGKNFFINSLTYGNYLLKNTWLGRKAYLRVSRGCPERCAYCTIFLAVGKLKSKKIDECACQYRQLLKQGYRNFVLLADNLGVYGADIGSNLAELFESLSAEDKNFSAKWDIRDLHPKWAIRYQDALSKYIAEGKIISLICAVQSGSDRMLKLMNRQHNIEEISGVLKKFRKLQPRLFLSTQLIFGFPSETAEDFLATLNAVKTIGFNLAMLYPYYDGSGSISSGMNNKIQEELILARLRKAADFFKREGILCTVDEVGGAKNIFRSLCAGK
jgi:tRNA A37 methylthiotransferase MiaB